MTSIEVFKVRMSEMGMCKYNFFPTQLFCVDRLRHLIFFSGGQWVIFPNAFYCDDSKCCCIKFDPPSLMMFLQQLWFTYQHKPTFPR